MKKLFLCSLFVGIVVLFSSCKPTTYDVFANLSGTVVEMETGDVVSNALITLSPSGKNTYTGIDGFFEFLDMEAGQYTLIVQATGYKTNRKTVVLVAGETQRVDITLSRQQ